MSDTLKKIAGCVAALLLAVAPAVRAQEPAAPPAEKKVPVLVLGTYHFGNPNLDYVKTDVDDHLSEKRQQEIQKVVDLLAKFKPTKIALELPAGDDRLQSWYEAYLRGEHELRVNESEQIGFRLAKQLGHAKVYAVDHKLDMDVGAVVAAAQQGGDRKFLETFQNAMAMIQDVQKRQSTQTVRENLAEMNDPEFLQRGRDLYLQLSRVRGGEGGYIGADVLSDWDRRNFRIFANLAAIVDSPEDRILAIFGSSHAPNLRELVESSPDLELVEAVEYLKGK
jgi:hypothetical protein